MAKLNTYGPCANDEDTSSPFAHLVRLDANNSMIVAPWRCGNGAYRFYANIMIVDGFGALRPATFDYDNGITGDGSGNVLVNAAWDESKRALESHDIYRAVGDCGRVDQFIWDGARFRLSEQRAMPECRGSVDRIRIWKLQVLDR